MVSDSALGIYSVGYQLGSIMMVLINGISSSWQPKLFHVLKNNEPKQQVVKSAYGMLALMLLAATAIWVASPIYFKLYDERYQPGIVYVPWVAYGFMFYGLYSVFVHLIYYHRLTKLMGAIAGANIIVNLLLNYLLIKQFGTMGAIYATIASFAVMAGLTFWFGQRKEPLPWFYFLKRK
jgi:O-antigen/teichoic acid export membrane protein